MAVRESRSQPEAGHSSSTWRGTRSPGSSATSASTRRSTSTTARWSTCKSTSSLFRGYSVFMKGKDPRDAHFITSRICGICGDNHAVCSCYAQQMAYGVKPPPLARVDRQPRRGGRVHLRPHHLPGQPGVRGLLRADGQGDQPERCWRRRRRPRRRTPSIHGYRTIADIMRSYNPFTGETYKEALQMSRIGREMICLMEGRHVHPSTLYPGGVGHGGHADAVHRLPEPAAALPGLHQEGRRDERRRLRLLLRGAAGLRGGRAPADPARLLGRVQQPRPRRLHVREHGPTGATRCSSPRASSSTASWSPRTSSTSTSASGSCSAAPTTTTGSSEETFVPTRPARQPGRQAPPVEPDDDPEAAEARPRGRQLLLGDEPALVRQAHRRPPGARHRRRRAGAAVGDGARRTRSTRRTSRRPATACRSTCRRRRTRPEQTLEWKIPQWSNAIERDRARIYFVAYAAGDGAALPRARR